MRHNYFIDATNDTQKGMLSPYGLKAIILTCLLILSICPPTYAQDNWLTIDEGLTLGLFPVPDSLATSSNIVVLKISPRHYRFTLLTKSEHGKALTPTQWAKKFKLAALINASMYLPDLTTSTGYMRAGAHLNNRKINNKFGAFFLAEPFPVEPATAQDNSKRKAAVSTPPPSAILIDKHFSDWQKQLPKYRIAIQNFRMISAGGKNLWSSKGREFSIAAIANDNNGNILFIQCHAPFTVHEFVNRLQALPLNIHKAMYVEGGTEASLHIRSKTITRTWSGRHLADFWSTDRTEHRLPNVLGIIKK